MSLIFATLIFLSLSQTYMCRVPSFIALLLPLPITLLNLRFHKLMSEDIRMLWLLLVERWSLFYEAPIIVVNFMSIILISEDVTLGVSDDTHWQNSLCPTTSNSILSGIRGLFWGRMEGGTQFCISHYLWILAHGTEFCRKIVLLRCFIEEIPLTALSLSWT